MKQTQIHKELIEKLGLNNSGFQAWENAKTDWIIKEIYKDFKK